MGCITALLSLHFESKLISHSSEEHVVLERVAAQSQKFHHYELVVDGIHFDLHLQICFLELDLELNGGEIESINCTVNPNALALTCQN